MNYSRTNIMKRNVWQIYHPTSVISHVNKLVGALTSLVTINKDRLESQVCNTLRICAKTGEDSAITWRQMLSKSDKEMNRLRMDSNTVKVSMFTRWCTTKSDVDLELWQQINTR
jgi:hypothetical protein